MGFPSGASGKILLVYAADIRDADSIHGPGKSPGRRHDHPLQYSCLENLMDRGAWWATVHSVTKSWTWLKWLNTHTSKGTYKMYFEDYYSLKLSEAVLRSCFYLFLLYNIVLVLQHINMKPPWAYTCSPSWTPLPLPSLYHPSKLSQCTSSKIMFWDAPNESWFKYFWNGWNKLIAVKYTNAYYFLCSFIKI